MRITAPIAFALVGFLSVPALAQQPAAPAAAPQQNGTTDRPQTPGTARMAPAGPVSISGPWNEFSFGAAGSFAKGCAPADSSAPGCGPSSAGNSHFAGPPPWTFVAPSDEPKDQQRNASKVPSISRRTEQKLSEKRTDEFNG